MPSKPGTGVDVLGTALADLLRPAQSAVTPTQMLAMQAVGSVVLERWGQRAKAMTPRGGDWRLTLNQIVLAEGDRLRASLVATAGMVEALAEGTWDEWQARTAGGG